MRQIFTIAFSFFFNCVLGQQNLKDCNCIKKPIDCIPSVSKRKIVSNDTTIAHHSYCYRIFSIDEKQRLVVLTTLCDKKPTDPFYLSFFEGRRLGMIHQESLSTSLGQKTILPKSVFGIITLQRIKSMITRLGIERVNCSKSFTSGMSMELHGKRKLFLLKKRLLPLSLLTNVITMEIIFRKCRLFPIRLEKLINCKSRKAVSVTLD